MEEKLRRHINNALTELGIEDVSFVVERPADISHGDWSTNVAMAGSKKVGKNPRTLAEEIVTSMSRSDLDMEFAIAGPGFINIKLSKDYFVNALLSALATEKFGNNETLEGKKVIVEYTDPNPFKEFHIGHLMSNTIGESISRLIEASGAETKRACYQGDVGLHVAKAVWGMKYMFPGTFHEISILQKQINHLANCYATGSGAYEPTDLSGSIPGGPTKSELVFQVHEINRHLYDRKDSEINEMYEWGRGISLEYFEKIYSRLGTKFDHYFFESKTGPFGKVIVEKHPDIFEKSDGAIVYKGDESRGLHTRVFINKDGLPTYEAKELGLAKIKYDTYPYDTSIVITANEVNDYFKVLLDAMSKVFPDLAQKTEHYSHGMLRLPTGKMSSRTGDVITAESLIDETKEKARTKIEESKFAEDEKDDVAERVAIGAIKYSILRQSAGKDIIFDFEQSLSFEGDSGPYLQYTYARTRSLLAKAQSKGSLWTPKAAFGLGGEVSVLHKYILRFPEIVLRAQKEREPHHVATYLIEIAREFNSFYGNTQILDGTSDEPYKLALTEMTSRILQRGLWMLGITTPERM